MGTAKKSAFRFTLIELLVSKTCQKSISLFLKKGEGCGDRGKTSFPVKRSFSPFSASHFTLIELLVVIAIIAILAAILLPTLKSARDRAKSADCISRLGQVGDLVMSYQNDFEFYPPGEVATTKDGTYASYATLLSSYLYPGKTVLQIYNDLTPYQTKANYEGKKRYFQNFICPIESKDSTGAVRNWIYSDGGKNMCRSYNYSFNLSLFGHFNKTPEASTVTRKATVMKNPARSALLFDGAAVKYNPDNVYYVKLSTAGRGLEYRHKNFCNTLFADGHVQALGQAEIPDVAYGTYQGTAVLFE